MVEHAAPGVNLLTDFNECGLLCNQDQVADTFGVNQGLKSFTPVNRPSNKDNGPKIIIFSPPHLVCGKYMYKNQNVNKVWRSFTSG